MDLELFVLAGYGQYVWSAFIFTFVICFFLFLKTKKEFQKKEKILLQEFEQVKSVKREIDKKRKTTEEILSSGSF